MQRTIVLIFEKATLVASDIRDHVLDVAGHADVIVAESLEEATAALAQLDRADLGIVTWHKPVFARGTFAADLTRTCEKVILLGGPEGDHPNVEDSWIKLGLPFTPERLRSAVAEALAAAPVSRLQARR